MAKMKSPIFKDVPFTGQSIVASTSWTRPCFIENFIPAAKSSPLVKSKFRKEIIVYIVPGGRGALLAMSVSSEAVSRTISAARRAERNRVPFMHKHSCPGRSAEPSNADPGAIFSMTIVPLDFRKASPIFSVGVRFTTVDDRIDGMVKGSSPLTFLDGSCCCFSLLLDDDFGWGVDDSPLGICWGDASRSFTPDSLVSLTSFRTCGGSSMLGGAQSLSHFSSSSAPIPALGCHITSTAVSRPPDAVSSRCIFCLVPRPI
mmetsp:Transcript_21172/g.49709  ORF Transcript_21172/g.49709 Transcript_21172/m.49709 type:complete len:259 (+) Transcript_21172:511-1287(+)